MFLIVDNARWHYAKNLSGRRIIILYNWILPPDGPDLNHIERVWKLTRPLCTHNEDSILSVLKSFPKPCSTS